jgi:hypothetical protein
LPNASRRHARLITRGSLRYDIVAPNGADTPNHRNDYTILAIHPKGITT